MDMTRREQAIESTAEQSLSDGMTALNQQDSGAACCLMQYQQINAWHFHTQKGRRTELC